MGTVERMKPRKIAVVSEARATYDTSNESCTIEQSDRLELQLIVTGMHLLKGVRVFDQRNPAGWVHARAVWTCTWRGHADRLVEVAGVEMQGPAQVFDMLKPISAGGGRSGGDSRRTVTAAYMNIPVAHIQSGDLRAISTDRRVMRSPNWRTSIFRFAKTPLSGCVKWERNPWRIFNVGAPQLDDVVQGSKLGRMNLASGSASILQAGATGHPACGAGGSASGSKQMEETLAAVSDSGYQALVIYPNVDAAGQEIISRHPTI